MTDETTDEGTAVDTIDPESQPEVAPEAHAAVEPATAEAVPFWQRPNVRRYLLPLITPIVVVIGLVVYVLNLSRVFLSAHGHIAVAVGTAITVIILLGATTLSNSSRLRSSSIGLMTAIFALVVFSSGWLVLGHSQVKGAGTTPLVAAGPANGAITITAAPGGVLTFAPLHLTVKPGIYSVTLSDGSTGPHTLNFDDASVLWAGVQVGGAGEKATSRIYLGQPGDYTFFCNIPGHRAAGMQGDIKVVGTAVTLEQAEASGKPVPAS